MMKGHERCANTRKGSRISPFLKRRVRTDGATLSAVSNSFQVEQLFKIGLSAVAEANIELLEPPDRI